MKKPINKAIIEIAQMMRASDFKSPELRQKLEKKLEILIYRKAGRKGLELYEANRK
jgi:hypothetical protein